jgi:hypothetical protein
MKSLTSDSSLVRHVETRDLYQSTLAKFVVDCADGTVNASITVKVGPEYDDDSSDSDDDNYNYLFVKNILVEIVEVANKTVTKKA